MNGPTNYREAVKLLGAAQQFTEPDLNGAIWAKYPIEERQLMVAMAQAHATLALAAAQIDTVPDPDEHGHRSEWNEATQ